MSLYGIDFFSSIALHQAHHCDHFGTSAYQFIWHLQWFISEVVRHKCSTAIVLIELLVLEVGRPHCRTDELLHNIITSQLHYGTGRPHHMVPLLHAHWSV